MKSVTDLKNSTEGVNSRCEKSEELANINTDYVIQKSEMKSTEEWSKSQKKWRKQVYEHMKKENIRGRQEREKRGKYSKP